MKDDSIFIARRTEEHMTGNWVNYCKDFNLNPRDIFILFGHSHGLCHAKHHKGTILKDHDGSLGNWMPELFEIIQEQV